MTGIPPFKVPLDGKFAQPNKGDISGNLYRTQNIDLKTNPGKIRIAPRIVVNTKDNDGGISNMGVPMAFVHLVNKYYAMCGVGVANADGTGKLFSSASDSPSAAFSAVSGSPTDINAEFSDMVYWANGNYAAGDIGRSLFVSTYVTLGGSQIRQLFGPTSTWHNTWFTATVSGTFRADGMHNMCVGFNKNLYITDDDRIIYVPFVPYQSYVNAVLTTAGAANSQAGTIDFLKQYQPIWIRSTSDRLWIALMDYAAGSSGKGYMAEWDAGASTITSVGPNKVYDIHAPCALSGCVYKDVMYIIDAFGILKKFDGTSFNEVARLPVANQNIEMPGIYSGQTNSRWIAQRGMDVVDEKINILVNNFVSTGVYVEDMPSGIWEFDPENPNQGLYHKGAPCADTNDWGQQLLNTVGAIFGTKRSTASFLMGASYYTDSGATSRNAIFYDDIANTTSRRGMITLPWFYANGITDVFQKAFYRFRQLVSGSKIIGKYRTSKSANLPFVASITWTSTTTFTSTDSNFQYASVGDEVEVVQGKGASTTAHILTIPAAVGGTYTVTLEDAIGFVSGSAKAKVNNFRKMGVISKQNTGADELSILKTEGTMQLKTEFRDEGNMEINDTTVTSVPHQQ